MSREDKIKRFANMLSKARIDSGKSRNQMAIELYVSPRTIQNWEDESNANFPNALQTIEWFHILGLNFVPYLMEFLHPTDVVPEDADSVAIRDRLHRRVDSLTDTEVGDLLYILEGNHGSSPHSYIQMCVANLHTPLINRHSVASTVLNNYKVAEMTGQLICTDEIMPDIDSLESAINSGLKSIGNNDFGYTEK